MSEEKNENDLEFWKKVMDSEINFNKMMMNCQTFLLEQLLERPKEEKKS